MSAAVLLGDLALSWADDIVADVDLPPDAHRRVRRVWADIRTEVLGGQYLDIVAEASGAESIHSAMTVNMYKTASYTVSRGRCNWEQPPPRIAPMCTPFSTRSVQTWVWRFSCATTCSGCSGTRWSPASRPATICDPANARCWSPKRCSWPTPPTRRRPGCCATAIGTDLTDAQVREVCAVIEQVGALAAVENQIERLTRQALTALADAPINATAKAGLSELARLAAHRSA